MDQNSNPSKPTGNQPQNQQGQPREAQTPEAVAAQKRRQQQMMQQRRQQQAQQAQAGKKPAPTKAAAKQGKQVADPALSDDYIKNDALASVILRNAYYKDGYRTMLKIAFFEGIALVVMLIIMVLMVATSKPQNVYFATTSDGRLIRMVPLSQPNLSDAALLSWVAQAATETMTFGFHDYKARLQDSSKFFTRQGWESFTQALQASRVIEAVEARQQVLSAVPGSAPVIIQEGVVNNQYRWVVEMPLVVTYKSGSSSRPDSMLVRLSIVRVPTLDNPSGVGIEQWIAVGRR